MRSRGPRIGRTAADGLRYPKIAATRPVRGRRSATGGFPEAMPRFAELADLPPSGTGAGKIKKTCN